LFWVFHSRQRERDAEGCAALRRRARTIKKEGRFAPGRPNLPRGVEPFEIGELSRSRRGIIGATSFTAAISRRSAMLSIGLPYVDRAHAEGARRRWGPMVLPQGMSLRALK